MKSVKQKLFLPEEVGYPLPAVEWLGSTRPPFTVWGSLPPAGYRWGVFCSQKIPASVLLGLHDVAQQWATSQTPVLGGFQGVAEQEVLTVLLQRGGVVGQCLGRGLTDNMRLDPLRQTGLTAGRLCLISPFPETVKRPTTANALYRNRLVASWAEKLLVGYASAGGNTWQVVQEALTWGKPVYALDNAANKPLFALGVLPYENEVVKVS